MADKVTKRQWYQMIRDYLMTSDFSDIDGAVAFIDNEVDLLDNKARKASERAATKRAEGDELRASIQSVLTTELQTADDIVAVIKDEYPEITKAKVTARLTQLCKAEIASKEQVKTEDGRRIMAYKLVNVDEE